MEEIKVGEYIRTKLGDIKKITAGFEFIIERYNKSENKIVNNSPNIIDLIEKGDYVNGYKVELVYLEGSTKYIKFENRDKTKVFENRIYDVDIKTIVTKEQFEKISYKVED